MKIAILAILLALPSLGYAQEYREPSLECVSLQDPTVEFYQAAEPIFDCVTVTGTLTCDGLEVTALNECEDQITLYARFIEPEFAGLGPVPDLVHLRPNKPETFTVFMWWEDFVDGDLTWDSCEWDISEDATGDGSWLCVRFTGNVKTKAIEPDTQDMGVGDMGGGDMSDPDMGPEHGEDGGSTPDGGADDSGCSQAGASPTLLALLVIGMMAPVRRRLAR